MPKKRKALFARLFSCFQAFFLLDKLLIFVGWCRGEATEQFLEPLLGSLCLVEFDPCSISSLRAWLVYPQHGSLALGTID